MELEPKLASRDRSRALAELDELGACLGLRSLGRHEKHHAVIAHPAAYGFASSTRESNTSALELVPPDERVERIGLVLPAPDEADDDPRRVARNAERSEVRRPVGARPDPFDPRIDHRTRYVPHALDESRLEQIGLQSGCLHGQRLRVTASGEQIGKAHHQPTERAQPVVIENDRRERHRDVVRELRVRKVPVPTAERAPSIQQIAARRAFAREGTGSQYLLDGSPTDDRNEQVPKPQIAPEHRAPFLHHLFQAALVVGDAFRLHAAIELEGGHAVHLVDGVPVVNVEHRHGHAQLIEDVHEERRKQRMRTRHDPKVQRGVVVLRASHDPADLTESSRDWELQFSQQV
jgi:hypothetical protein